MPVLKTEIQTGAVPGRSIGIAVDCQGLGNFALVLDGSDDEFYAEVEEDGTERAPLFDGGGADVALLFRKKSRS